MADTPEDYLEDQLEKPAHPDEGTEELPDVPEVKVVQPEEAPPFTKEEADNRAESILEEPPPVKGMAAWLKRLLPIIIMGVIALLKQLGFAGPLVEFVSTHVDTIIKVLQASP